MVLKGKLEGNTVIIERRAIEELYNTSFYGHPIGDTLEVSLTEGAYLVYLGRITIEFEGKLLDFKQFFILASNMMKNFELVYITYKDLRERGYYVQANEIGFSTYPRGGHPTKTSTESLIFVTSERIPLLLSDLRKNLEITDNMKKRMVLAIVDEESDITYYEVKKTIPSGSCMLKLNKLMSTASLLEDRVIVWDPDASSILLNRGFFGKPMGKGYLQLSLIESYYLLNNGILRVEKRDNDLDPSEFSRLASRIESDFMTKYSVYRELRNSGLIPKTGFKFGTHFRVYKNFENISELSHSNYLVHAIECNHVFLLQQLSRTVRLANSVRKEMIYGVVDSQVEFFTIGRMRM